MEMAIEIDIADPVTFAGVARIVDQDAFTNRVDAIRKSWGLNSFIPSQYFSDWLNESHIDLPFTPEVAASLDSSNECLEIDVMHGNVSLYDEFDKNKQLSSVRVIDFELEYTLHKLNLDLSLKPMLLKVIVCNKVTAEDLPDDKKTNEVLYKDWLFEDLYYGYKPKTGTILDTKPEIARDRQWYWLHKSGKSYLQIAKLATDRGSIDPSLYKSNVVMQIKRYEQFLSINI